MKSGLTSVGGFVVATLVDGQGTHSGVQFRTNADTDYGKTAVRNAEDGENKSQGRLKSAQTVVE